jgi:hypothetical protein
MTVGELRRALAKLEADLEVVCYSALDDGGGQYELIQGVERKTVKLYNAAPKPCAINRHAMKKGARLEGHQAGGAPG